MANAGDSMWRIALAVILILPISYVLWASAARQDIEGRVDGLLRNMTLEQKIDFIGGVDGFYIRGDEQLGIPRMKMADGPFGVRGSGPATTVAGGIALAATWNPALAERIGVELGRDARSRGVHFLLAPGVNMYRAPVNGRNFEYFGEDPLLAGRLGAAYIRGVQSQGISATVKHFLGNNSEFDRHKTDAVIDERALHEIYLPAFEAAVKEGRVASIMTAYNPINGIYASQHPLINDVIKNAWGFDGIVMSDWSSTYDGVAAAKAGLDVEMPSAVAMNRNTLMTAIKEGKLSEGDIDDKVRRILRVAARLGWLDRPAGDAAIPFFNQAGRQVALQSAREAMVLLKNDQALLPIDRKSVKTIAVIGPTGYPAVPVGGGSAAAQPFSAVSFVEGIALAFGAQVEVFHHRGVTPIVELADRTNFTTEAKGDAPGIRMEAFLNPDLSGAPAATRVDQRINMAGTFHPSGPGPKGSSARWTGYFRPERAGPHRIFFQQTRGDGGHRVYVDDKLVIDNWRVGQRLVTEARVTLGAGPHRIVLEQSRRNEWGNAATRLGIVHEDTVVDPVVPIYAKRADFVVATVGFDTESEGEASDRTWELPTGQDDLIRAVVAANPRTVVALTSGGGVDMTAWIDRVPALIQTWYAGQEAGTALGQLIAGDVNFSGRLPATFERRLEDNPAFDSYYPAPGSTRVVYANGIFNGYRGFERNKTSPLFPFGFGLSYTKFDYGRLSVAPKSGGAQPHYTVSFEVKNSGGREGMDVAQVYVSEAKPRVPRPPKELKGFAKVSLRPGESRTVTVDLDARAFSFYDVSTHQWRVNDGEFEILLGRSSADIVLRETVKIGR